MSDKPQTSASASVKDSQSLATTDYERGNDESIAPEEFSGGRFYINLSVPALIELVISRGKDYLLPMARCLYGQASSREGLQMTGILLTTGRPATKSTGAMG